MKIELKDITVKELVEDYNDDGEGGVVGYGGKLDISPPYQREFIYKDEPRNAVINTVTRSFPLNVMYWADRGDDTYEIIDGQQRTISIAQYIKGDFSLDGLYFHNLPSDKQDQILDYKLMIYICSGTDSEKLDWFKTINIAGVELTNQELRNAVYSGSWVSDAKRYFSRNGCAAYEIGKDYLKGKRIRQEYLETAIKWISDGNIKDYMGQHQHDADADELWSHFQTVIGWIKRTFPKKRVTLMCDVDWGSVYNDHHDDALDPDQLEAEIRQLLSLKKPGIENVIRKPSGVYQYVLDGDERHLNLRTFSNAQKQAAYESQNGKCAKCRQDFEYEQMEGDHKIPWKKGGLTTDENLEMLCRECNRKKG